MVGYSVGNITVACHVMSLHLHFMIDESHSTLVRTRPKKTICQKRKGLTSEPGLLSLFLVNILQTCSVLKNSFKSVQSCLVVVFCLMKVSPFCFDQSVAPLFRRASVTPPSPLSNLVLSVFSLCPCFASCYKYCISSSNNNNNNNSTHKNNQKHNKWKSHLSVSFSSQCRHDLKTFPTSSKAVNTFTSVSYQVSQLTHVGCFYSQAPLTPALNNAFKIRKAATTV